MYHKGIDDPPVTFECGVTVIPKTKRCGKDNCGDCPHGPYWYARAPHTASSGGARLDVYMGSGWDESALLAKVAPLLNAATRAALEREIAVIRDKEKLWELQRALDHARHERVRLNASYQQQLRDNQQRIIKLNQECAALTFKLNPPKPRKIIAHPKGKKAHA